MEQGIAYDSKKKEVEIRAGRGRNLKWGAGIEADLKGITRRDITKVCEICPESTGWLIKLVDDSPCLPGPLVAIGWISA